MILESARITFRLCWYFVKLSSMYSSMYFYFIITIYDCPKGYFLKAYNEIIKQCTFSVKFPSFLLKLHNCTVKLISFEYNGGKNISCQSF